MKTFWDIDFEKKEARHLSELGEMHIKFTVAQLETGEYTIDVEETIKNTVSPFSVASLMRHLGDEISILHKEKI